MVILHKGAGRLEQHVTRVVECDAIRQPDGRQHSRLRVVVILLIAPVKEYSTKLSEIIVCVNHLVAHNKKSTLLANLCIFPCDYNMRNG